MLQLTNPTSAAIVGSTTPRAFGFVAVDGVVAWHAVAGLDSSGLASEPFTLQPGASLELPMTLVAASCTVDDDLAALETGAFPAGLPALPPGTATVGAALDVLIEGIDGSVLLDLVVSPPATVTITG